MNNDKDIAFDDRGMNWQHSACMKNCTGNICFYHELESVNFQEPPYSIAYPEIVNIYDEFPCLPIGNVIEDNKYCHKESPASAEFIDRDMKTINDRQSFVSNNVEDCILMYIYLNLTPKLYMMYI